MYVINRKGEQEPCKFDKISERIASLSWGLSEAYCDPVRRARGSCRTIVAARRGRRGRLWGLRARAEQWRQRNLTALARLLLRRLLWRRR